MDAETERLKLLELVYALDTRLARIEQRLDVLLERRIVVRQSSPRRVACELAYANPHVGQVWRRKDTVKVCHFVTTAVEPASLEVELTPASWDPAERRVVRVMGPTARVPLCRLRDVYAYVGEAYGYE